MDICVDIEKFLFYAQENLLLDEMNVFYARGKIMDLLRLDKYVEYEIDEDAATDMNARQAVAPMVDYAVANGIISGEETEDFVSRLFDAVSLTPGEVVDMFDSLAQKNLSKAMNWMFDYGIKNGSVKLPLKKWEAKGDKNIEVFFSGKDVNIKGGYPACSRCRENEGFGSFRNKRFAPIGLSEETYFTPANKAFYGGAGEIVGGHRPMVIDRGTVGLMFDFIEKAPEYFIAADESNCFEKHEHFIVGAKLLPLHKTAERSRIKNADYPYINISVLEWYTSAVRLACTNRAKLSEFVIKLIEDYAKQGGKCALSLRKVESKFTIDLLFIGDKEVSPENLSLGGGKVCLLGRMGVFKINETTENQLSEIEKYLTKEIRFSPMSLVGGMEVHAKMIDRLLKVAANVEMGKIEAALEVKEECQKIFIGQLTDTSPLSDSEVSELLTAIKD